MRNPNSDLMTVWAHLLTAEINLTAMRAFSDFTSYLNATTRTGRSLVTDLATTFWTFNNCHSFI